MSFSLQISRQFSTTSCLMLRRLSKRSNPGLGYQISAIEDAAEIIKNDPEGFGGLESDLMNAHKSHKQHELDLEHQKEKIRQYIIQKKYFRQDPLPNLLTYAEKEQIKFLHTSDNEEWTVEKLAESFPASTETIRKILKVHWMPISVKRILFHDATVLRNWERFKKGEYKKSMRADLNEHLKKFVDRDIKNLNILQDPTQTFKIKQWQKPKSNEFSSIVTSLHKNKKTKNVTSLSDGKSEQMIKEITSESADTYLTSKIQYKKPMTIKELKNKHLFENAYSTNVNDDKLLDQMAAQKLNNATGTGLTHNNITSSAIALDYSEKFISNEVVISEADRKRYEMSATKERICIPKKLRKKGATYRANDCYYDDDGEFLYSVPGMTSR